MIFLIYFFVLLWAGTHGWGYKNDNFHDYIGLEQAAGVCHIQARSGKYKLTYEDAEAMCEYEGGHLATYNQLEAARKTGFHVCAAGWMAKGRVGYPIVTPHPNCGFGKTGIIDYGLRINRSETWDAYCYNAHAKECGGIFTDPKRVFKSPESSNEYDDNQVCYWHIRLQYGQHIDLHFLDFHLQDDPNFLADYFEIHDNDNDIHAFVGRHCGDEVREDFISTGNVMTLKFLSDASVTAGGFQIKYVAVDPPSKSSQGKNISTIATGNKNVLAGRFSHL